MLFGGLMYTSTNNSVRRSTDMYVLDFSEATPRWRRAAVDNVKNQGAYQFGFPNTGIVPLPEIGAVALMHRSVSKTQVCAVAQALTHDNATHCYDQARTVSRLRKLARCVTCCSSMDKKLRRLVLPDACRDA
jgi:hypothetical protein